MTHPLRRLVALVASIAAPVLVLAFMLFGLPAPAQARAADSVVNNCTAAGLRAGILAAGSGGLVTFNCTIGGPTIVVTQSQAISRDITIDGGGVITISGGDATRIFAVPSAQKATLLNITLANGSSTQGGALSVSGLAVISNVTLIHNKSTLNGGAIEVLGLGTADVSLSRFYSNTAPHGGAIHSAGGLGVDQSYFFGNTAHNGSGGAIDQASGAALVVASTFISNGAEFGGAIYAQGRLTLVGDEFDRNGTPFSFPAIGHPGGGALHLTVSSNVLVRQSRFVSNTAEVAGLGVGGAIANEGSLTVFDTLFSQNSAPAAGGAIFNDSGLTMTLGTFIRNSSLDEGGAISNTGNVSMTTSTFVTNTSGLSGGAIANARQVFMQYSLFFNNTAANGGGALRNHTGAVVVIGSSTLYSNTAVTGAGGAILNNGGTVAVNSTFVANNAGASGGAALNISAGSPPANFGLSSSTVVSNTAASAGAALRRIDGTFIMANTIVAFNTPVNCQGAIVDSGHNLQFSGLSCGAGVTNTNPLLGPLQDNGGPRVGVFGVALPTLQPLLGSPAIDAGDDSKCEPTDERGFLRTSPCDIGALEGLLRVLLPLVQK